MEGAAIPDTLLQSELFGYERRGGVRSPGVGQATDKWLRWAAQQANVHQRGPKPRVLYANAGFRPRRIATELPIRTCGRSARPSPPALRRA